MFVCAKSWGSPTRTQENINSSGFLTDIMTTSTEYLVDGMDCNITAEWVFLATSILF